MPSRSRATLARVVNEAILAVQRTARRAGVDVRRWFPEREAEFRRQRLIERLQVARVLDVGANEGQYGTRLREAGFTGELHSFEPLPDAYRVLAQAAQADPRWSTHRLAAGAEDGTAQLNVAANSVSSSLLPMEDRHLAAAPESRYTGQVEVRVATLDGLLGEAAAPTLLKIDVQGAEDAVLAGAGRVLESVVALELELALVPVYTGQRLLGEVLPDLQQRGFSLVSVEPVLVDPETGYTLQVDGLFVRQERV